MATKAEITAQVLDSLVTSRYLSVTSQPTSADVRAVIGAGQWLQLTIQFLDAGGGSWTAYWYWSTIDDGIAGNVPDEEERFGTTYRTATVTSAQEAADFILEPQGALETQTADVFLNPADGTYSYTVNLGPQPPPT